MGVTFDPQSGPWTIAYQQSFEAVQLPGGSYKPMDPILLPVLEKRVLAAGIASQGTTITWKYGGRLVPLIDCGSAGFGSAETFKFSLFLNSFRILILPEYARQYRLRFEPSFRLSNCSLTIWEFDGSVTDSP